MVEAYYVFQTSDTSFQIYKLSLCHQVNDFYRKYYICCKNHTKKKNIIEKCREMGFALKKGVCQKCQLTVSRGSRKLPRVVSANIWMTPKAKHIVLQRHYYIITIESFFEMVRMYKTVLQPPVITTTCQNLIDCEIACVVPVCLSVILDIKHA